MKLTAKLISIFFLNVIALVAVNGYLAVLREVALFEQEMADNHRRVGSAVEPLVLDIWRTTGRGGVIEAVTRLQDDEQRVRIRWVWLNGSSNDAAWAPRATADRLTGVGPEHHVSVTLHDVQGKRIFCTYYQSTFPIRATERLN